MELSRIICISITLVSFALLVRSLPADVGSSVTTPAPATGEVKVMTCVVQIGERNFTDGASCKNGRRMDGCCIERTWCDFSTSNIDLIMYGPTGYRDPCDGKYICCPRTHALPVVVDESGEPDVDDNLDQFKDDDAVDD